MRLYTLKEKGQDIFLEARIVAVADIFNALTSKCPYKTAWLIKKPFTHFGKWLGENFDEDCVQALLDNETEILTIQDQFKENMFH